MRKKSKYIFKKVILSATCLIVSCGIFFGCSKENTVKESGVVTVWTTGNRKILQGSDYQHLQGNRSIQVSVFRNEYENAQIILSSTKDVREYSVEKADLTNAQGEVFPKENISLYHQKYVRVSQIHDVLAVDDDGNSVQAGYYPDALVPLDNAIAYSENKVGKNENQGVWVSVYASKTQAAGVYTGTFRVVADGESFDVPVSVSVYDYTLSDEVHSQSMFGLDFECVVYGELDSSIEMQEKYQDFLYEHRISSSSIPGVVSGSSSTSKDETIQRFCEYAYEAALNPKCSVLRMPYALGGAVVDGVQINAADWPLFDKYVRALMQYSAEKGVDLIKKCMTYFTYFDEYDIRNIPATANYSLYEAKRRCELLAAEAASLDCDDELKAEIAYSVKNMRHICVGALTDGLTAPCSICPLIDELQDEGARREYREWVENSYDETEEDGLWTYTAMNPDSPYPTYHLEDVLSSSRILSWMMYDYDVRGNLYWYTDLWGYYKSASIVAPLTDYYQNVERFGVANGDGWLLYPGRVYGVDGPIGSIRLQSIRDGLEEYDLLYALEEGYKTRAKQSGRGNDFDSVYDLITSGLYSGVQIATDGSTLETMAKARKQLADLLILMQNTGGIIEKYSIEGGQAVAVVSLPDTATLESSAAVTYTQENGYKIYTVKASLANDSNALQFTCKNGDKSASVKISLGGKNQNVSVNTLQTNVKITSGSASITQMEGREVLKLNLTKEKDSGINYVNFNLSAQNVGKNFNTLTFDVYVEKDMTVSLQYYTGETLKTLKDVQLYTGWNTVTVKAGEFTYRDTLTNFYMSMPYASMNAAGESFYVAELNFIGKEK